jgi:hypothetical protein
MATPSTSAFAEAGLGRTLSITRLIVTGGITAAAVFVLCWIGTVIPFSSPTHAYISLFTSAPVASTQALVEGTIWSLLFGALVGGLFALIYNVAAPLARR